MEKTLDREKPRLAFFKPYVQIRVNSGHFWLDLVFLVIITSLHHALGATLSSWYLNLDLLTPWLVCTFVVLPLPRAAVIGFFGAIMLETHSAAPAGLYICCFWVIAVTLELLRPTLSWRHRFPWFVTFLVAEIWVIGFESFVLFVTQGLQSLSIQYGLNQLSRLMGAVIFGLYISRRFLLLDTGEEEEL